MKTIRRLSISGVLISLLFLSANGRGRAWTQVSSTGQIPSHTGKMSAAKAAPTAQEIADAKTKDLVWVNTSTRVYHKSASHLYGATKRGKFMTEDDAKKAGYRAASESSNEK